MLFNSLGADTAKAQSPLILSLEPGAARSLRLAEVRDLGVEKGISRSVM